MKNYQKYSKGYFMPPEIDLEWAKKDAPDKAPVWCSVDMRDGNQALIIPMNLDEKLEFYKMLLKVGFKEIEVGFPAASETEYEFLRRLVEDDLIPDDVTIQVLTQAREHIIRKTFEALKGVKNAIVHVYNSTSVAAIGVAAHECGHVMQHEQGYLPLRIRTALVPVANIGSNIGIWIVMIGVILGMNSTLAMIGVYLFSFGVLFQIVTLPVEFNASRRALAMLQDYGMLGQTEIQGSRSVLSAAAMTYVASAAASVLQLLRLLMIVNGGRRRD